MYVYLDLIRIYILKLINYRVLATSSRWTSSVSLWCFSWSWAASATPLPSSEGAEAGAAAAWAKRASVLWASLGINLTQILIPTLPRTCSQGCLFSQSEQIMWVMELGGSILQIVPKHSRLFRREIASWRAIAPSAQRSRGRRRQVLISRSQYTHDACASVCDERMRQVNANAKPLDLVAESRENSEECLLTGNYFWCLAAVKSFTKRWEKSVTSLSCEYSSVCSWQCRSVIRLMYQSCSWRFNL